MACPCDFCEGGHFYFLLNPAGRLKYTTMPTKKDILEAIRKTAKENGGIPYNGPLLEMRSPREVLYEEEI